MSNSPVKTDPQTGNTPQQPAKQPQLGDVTEFRDQKTGQMVPFMLQNVTNPATGQIGAQFVPVNQQVQAQTQQLGEVKEFQDKTTGQMVPFMLQNQRDPRTGQTTMQWVPVNQQAHAPSQPQSGPLGGQSMPNSTLMRGDTSNPTLKGLGESSSYMGDRTKIVLESDAEKLIDWNALDESSKKMYISKKDGQSTGYLCVLSCAGYCPASKIVSEGYNGMILKKGIYQRTVAPGLRTFNPCTEEIKLIYMGTQTFRSGGQQLLTLDAVTVRVDSFINYKVVDPYIVTFKVKSYENVILLYLQETMKSVFSSYKLSDIVKNRKEVEGQMTGILKGFLLPYGLFILQCNASTIDLPARLDRAMAAESEATKKARAKIIDAQANLNTAKQMRESADEFSKNTVSLELQFYDVIKHMLRVGDSQVILPDSILGKL